MYDLVIRGGNLVDGTGSKSREADVAINGDRIAAVGRNLGRGKQEVDARDKLVTPGFVDMHTHFDAQVTWDPTLSPSSGHGCTTVVMGNCGVGFAPCFPDRRKWLIGLMEGVEDIPGAAMVEGIQWAWESFPEYLDALDAEARTIDFATYIPHGPVRAYVMGRRGAHNEPATEDDIAAMYRIVKEGMEAGAMGFSMSRTMLHKAIDGRPVPGTHADRNEIFGVARALREVGAGVVQFAAEHTDVLEEIGWMRDLAREHGRPVMVNLNQVDQDPSLWRQVLAQIEAARAEGLPLLAQVAGRSIGVLMNFGTTVHPFSTYPSHMKLMHLHPEERREALMSPELRRQLLEEEEPFSFGEFEDFVTRSWHKMYPCRGNVDYEPAPEDSVAAIAEREGKRPQEVAYDALSADDGNGFLYFPLFNYSDNDLSPLHDLHRHPATRMGLSDAGAHCATICDGGMPTFMLTHWTRDRRRGPRLELEHVIKRQTSETALTLGLEDRGIVAPGMKADINVIDYDSLRLESPRVVYDLPAGGRRLLQRARGYEATICSGQIVVRHDELTGARPGRLVRGGRT